MAHAGTASFDDQRQERVFERRGAFAGLAVQLVERALGDQPAAGDDADAVGHALGDFQDMRGHDHGAAVRDALAQHRFDLTRGRGIEAGERLVEDDHARVVHQRAGERHLLAHALGESLATFVDVAAEIEPVQQLERARLGDVGIDAPEPGHEGEVFERRELVVDHRLVRNPRHHPLGGDRIGQGIDPEDRNRAAIRPQQPDHHLQCRGLAGAVGTEQRIELAGAHAQVEVLDHRPVKALGQAADFDGARRLETHLHASGTRSKWSANFQPI